MGCFDKVHPTVTVVFVKTDCLFKKFNSFVSFLFLPKDFANFNKDPWRAIESF